MHTSRYRCCDLSLSSPSPTANQGGAECHHCGHPQQNRCPMHEVSIPLPIHTIIGSSYPTPMHTLGLPPALSPLSLRPPPALPSGRALTTPSLRPPPALPSGHALAPGSVGPPHPLTLLLLLATLPPIRLHPALRPGPGPRLRRRRVRHVQQLQPGPLLGLHARLSLPRLQHASRHQRDTPPVLHTRPAKRAVRAVWAVPAHGAHFLRGGRAGRSAHPVFRRVPPPTPGLQHLPRLQPLP